MASVTQKYFMSSGMFTRNSLQSLKKESTAFLLLRIIASMVQDINPLLAEFLGVDVFYFDEMAIVNLDVVLLGNIRIRILVTFLAFG